MKNAIKMTVLFALLALSSASPLVAQEVGNLKIIKGFDSLELRNVTTKGNEKTGTMEVSMVFRNISHKKQKAHLNVGGYNAFGFITDNGKKYKVFTEENLLGNNHDNNGFNPITSIRFGSKKLQWVTSLVQELNPNEEQPFVITLAKFDKKAKEIKDLHIRCILFVNYMHAGDRNYVIESIPLVWEK